MINRPNNQLHGKKFEDVLQRLFGCPNQYIRDFYDIPAEHNEDWDLPTSIKTTCRNRVDLASAPVFFRNKKPMHIVVGHYFGVNEAKVVYKVTEYLLSGSALRTLKGNLPTEEVDLFDSSLKSFARGEHDRARVFAESCKAEFMARYGSMPIMLNPKIDNKKQRRVQCSVRLVDLKPYRISETTINYKGLKLPYRLV